MTSLTDFDSYLDEHPFDITRELCFRAAGRTFGLLSIIENRSATLKPGDTDSLYLDFFRSLLLISKNLNSSDPKTVSKCSDYYKHLEDHLANTLYAIAYRSALATNLPNGKDSNRENLRRCMQSILDNGRNYAGHLGYNPQFVFSDIWEDFEYHLKSLIYGGKGNTLPPIRKTSPFFKAWQSTARRILRKNETWNVWIEWFDFRFLGKPGEHIPSFLWREIEDLLSNDNEFLQTSDAVVANGIFAQTCLSSLEKLVDHQANEKQVPAGFEFAISDDDIRVKDFQHSFPVESDIKITAAREVAFASDQMLIECDANSASYLKPIVQRYRQTFSDSHTWNDNIELVMRGDAVRRAFEAQVRRGYDSDLPELTDTVLLSFRNMIKAHNALIALHPELWNLDEAVSTSRSMNNEDPYEGLTRIVKFSQTQKYLDSESREALEFMANNHRSESERDLLVAGLSVFNFVQVASSWVWHHRKAIVASTASIGTAGYAAGSWILANETWLLKSFSIDSSAGALVRAALQVLKGLPLA